MARCGGRGRHCNDRIHAVEIPWSMGSFWAHMPVLSETDKVLSGLDMQISPEKTYG